MALGIKIKKVKFKNKYTIQELYEAIKDKEFTAGVPELTKHGFAYIITFPALDDQNQVWVMAAGFGKSTNKYSIQKQDRAGVGNLAKNMALNSVTNGFYGIGGMAGDNVKKCEQLVVDTAKELEAMDL